MLTAILKEAWISIASYKLRTFLTMLGIMIGVAAESWLPDMIGQYQKSKEAWNELTERWFGR